MTTKDTAISLSSESSCPVNGGRVILEDTNPTRRILFHHSINVIRYNYIYVCLRWHLSEPKKASKRSHSWLLVSLWYVLVLFLAQKLTKRLEEHSFDHISSLPKTHQITCSTITVNLCNEARSNYFPLLADIILLSLSLCNSTYYRFLGFIYLFIYFCLFYLILPPGPDQFTDSLKLPVKRESIKRWRTSSLWLILEYKQS